MTYHVVARWGDSEDAPDAHRMREILAQLDEHDPEHPDAWLTHESGWTLTVSESGVVVWENPESAGEPRHRVSVSREEALSLWLKLSRGDIAAIEREPWRPGQCPPLSAEDRAELIRQAEEATLAQSRRFYDQLGPENAAVPCRRTGCNRGSVRFSLFCRVHHYESLYHCPCPFDD
jgi:hypothetical protein